MYIIKTTTGEEIKIDYDELARLDVTPDTLIYFRRGAVIRRLVGMIVEDEEAKENMKRKPGESVEKALQRLREKKSEDIFEALRNKSIQQPKPKELS